MVSILAQERLLGFALGTIFTGAVVFEERKSVYRLISQNQCEPQAQYQRFEPFYEKKSQTEFSYFWNKAVDQTLGPVIAALSSRGW